MKKTFPLQVPGKNDARVRDKIRQELNNYVRRELQKKLPEDFDRWVFNCKAGGSVATAESCSLKDVGGTIDAVALAGAKEVYIEIIAVPTQRKSPN